MEVLHILEEKIARLIESKKQDIKLIEQLKQNAGELEKNCKRLECEVKKLEDSLLLQNKDKATAEKERNNTKLAVDDLISSIDALIESGSQK